jgi:hypothetical protein
MGGAGMYAKVLGSSVAIVALYLATPANAGDLDQGAAPPSAVTSASIDFVYATRENDDNHVIIEDTITGSTILDSKQFGFDWEPGVDARLNIASGNYGVGLRFFGGFNFDDNAKVTTSTIWNFPTNPPLFGLGIADVNSKYDSSLDSVELNGARLFGDAGAVFVGLRGIMVDEKLKNVANFGGNVATITLDSDTAAIGPQLGGQFHFGDRFFVEGDGRVAALTSSTDASFGVKQAVGPAFAANGSFGNWLLLAEGGIAAGVRIGPSFSLRAGYRVLFIDDIATAPGLVDKVDVLNASINEAKDEILIHGFTAGGKFVF